MPIFCAVPPLDQAATRIGRGYGLGYNRARTAANQLHGGMDFVADRGSPVVAPIPGVVVLKGSDSGPGRVRAMNGYGNFVVLEHRFDVTGLPNPFWTSYNHLMSPVALEVGQQVGTGTLLGQVGNTTNGQFAGMGAHLHFEVRRRPFPGSYDRDTVDPGVLFRGLGIDHVDARREVQRLVGGQLLVRSGGPSDCRAGQAPTIGLSGADLCAHGWMGSPCPFCPRPELGDLTSVPAGYVDPAAIRRVYEPHGVSRSNQNIESPALHPPDYAEMIARNTNAPRPSGGGNGFVVVGIGAAALGWALFGRR